MLVLIVVFTSFGIVYSKRDFVSTMLKVEHGLGDASDKILTTYDKSSNILGKIYNFLDSSIHFSELFDNIYSSFVRFLSKVDACVSLISRFGFTSKTLDSFSVLFKSFERKRTKEE